jgi:hypothetical protein
MMKQDQEENNHVSKKKTEDVQRELAHTTALGQNHSKAAS